MKKVLRKILFALVLSVLVTLLTSCGNQLKETKQEAKITPETIVQPKETTEEYEIISAHVGNINQLEPYITFCYEKNGEIIFETISTRKFGRKNEELYCDMGEENKVIIKTYSGEDNEQTKYFITLTQEMYQRIYK